MGTSGALDQAVQSEVVGHRAARVGGEVAAEEGGDVGAQLAVAEAGQEMGEAAEGLEQRQDPRVAEAKRRDTLAVLLARDLELTERVLAQQQA